MSAPAAETCPFAAGSRRTGKIAQFRPPGGVRGKWRFFPSITALFTFKSVIVSIGPALSPAESGFGESVDRCGEDSCAMRQATPPCEDDLYYKQDYPIEAYDRSPSVISTLWIFEGFVFRLRAL